MSSSEKRTLNIPIDEWIRLMDSGVCAPAVVTPTGNSMWPMIRSGRDTLEVHPVEYDSIFGIVTKVHRGHLTLNPYVAPPVINSFRKMLQSVRRIKRKIFKR